jgi:DNA-directed RNA polymerase alpha subunit
MNIDDLELTIRSNNALRASGIDTVEKLIALDWEQINSLKNAGAKSVSEICWSCIQLLSGRMTEKRIEWDKKWPPRPTNWEELYEKANKYDKIMAIIEK